MKDIEKKPDLFSNWASILSQEDRIHMNKTGIILAGVTAAAVVLFAGISELPARPYGMAGCGLGSQVIKKDGFNQVFASTTNQTSSNQTYGITSGTSNCVADDVAFKQRRQEYFVAVNFESLQQEMAVGKGEKLESLASLLGCPVADLGRMTRKEYAGLFPSNVTPDSLMQSMRTKIAGDATLARACGIKS